MKKFSWTEIMNCLNQQSNNEQQEEESSNGDLSGGALESNINALVEGDSIGGGVVLELDSTGLSSIGRGISDVHGYGVAGIVVGGSSCPKTSGNCNESSVGTGAFSKVSSYSSISVQDDVCYGLAG